MIFSGNHNSNGRLGNQVMRLMGLMGLAKRYNTEYAIPEWKYAQYFETPINQKQVTKFDQFIKEQDFHYTPEFWDKQDFTKTINFSGWLQSPKYWNGCKLEFKPSYLNEVKSKHHKAYEKPTIAISARRGDFVANENYYQLPINYYVCALFENFPNWEDYNLLFFSDDIEYCRVHFGCLDNAYFRQGSDIEQLALMTLCDFHILSNSTFSYCGAYLSNSSAVIRPKYNFAGPLAQRHSEKDFWPTLPNWSIFEHERKKIDLKDVTFTIPVCYDHPDRKQNLELSICLLQKCFDTNIILMEQGGSYFEYMAQYVDYRRFTGATFHRTRMLNDMAKRATTPYILNWDADMLCSPLQVYQAVQKLRQGADMVYPFDGRFARVPRLDWFRKLERFLDVGVFGKTQFRGMNPEDRTSYGGAVLFNKESFIRGGMENEKMISYAPEDFERYERFTKLGFKVERVKGTIYHLDHFKGTDSSGRLNPYFPANKSEYEKVKGMGEQELREYVSTWEWVKQLKNA